MRMLQSLAVTAIVALSLLVQDLSAQNVLTPEILNSLHRVGSLTLAPDGKHLLFTISTPDIQANKGSTKVYLLNLMEAGRKPTEVAVGPFAVLVAQQRVVCVGRQGRDCQAPPV